MYVVLVQYLYSTSIAMLTVAVQALMFTGPVR